MTQPYKDAVGICKTIIRNGFEAYVINARMQQLAQGGEREMELDIATDLDFEGLDKLFHSVEPSNDAMIVGLLTEGDIIYRFYCADTTDTSHPDMTTALLTPRLLKKLEEEDELPLALACPYIPSPPDRYEGFADLSEGVIRFAGLPDDTLKRNYLRGIRALRFSANYNLPIEPNSWMSIVRGARRILDYVSQADIMDEWKKVEAENLHTFVKLLFDAQILHGMIPEVAALARVRQIKNGEVEENVFEHTLEVMRYYPEELPYDWYGTMACLFHDVGKLSTAEWFEGQWNFHNHHRVGAKLARRILKRLQFEPGDVDLIVNLVRHHMRFHFMLTDRGIRRFRALSDYPRLIEIARADVKARGGNYTEFNHNMKMMERTETPEDMIEPLLNGNEIMDFTELPPGPAIGLIRDALLQAQIAGDVSSIPESVDFVMGYVRSERLG